MSKKFLGDVLAQSAEMSAAKASQVVGEIIVAIKEQLVETGRFTILEFGSFVVKERPKRQARNPRTGEVVEVEVHATVGFRASPALKEAAFAGLKKAKRNAAKG